MDGYLKCYLAKESNTLCNFYRSIGSVQTDEAIREAVWNRRSFL
jgi:hypothetical protein